MDKNKQLLLVFSPLISILLPGIIGAFVYKLIPSALENPLGISIFLWIALILGFIARFKVEKQYKIIPFILIILTILLMFVEYGGIDK